MLRRLMVECLETRALLDGGGVGIDHMLAEGESEVRADFHLVDVNPSSPRYGHSVSPRDYLQQVSAWYFGHAT